MNDFISLSCPSCGGHLKLDNNTREYTCDYCGTSHRVRNEDIEAYGRCPICKRNDKVEKVSALINKQEGLARLFPPPEFLKNYNNYLPGRKPGPLPAPHYVKIPKKKWNIFKILGFIVLDLSVILIALSSMRIITSEDIMTIICCNGFVFFVALILLTIGLSSDRKASDLNHSGKIVKWKEDNQKNIEDWENRERIAFNRFREEIKYQTKRNAIVMERYNSLYYCSRDDCIFIPGEDGHAAPSDLKKFLYKDVD